MMIACPRCGAQYEVDTVAFGPRSRVVACTACGGRWRQEPAWAETPPAPPVTADPAESPATGAVEAPAPDRGDLTDEPDVVAPEPPPRASGWHWGSDNPDDPVTAAGEGPGAAAESGDSGGIEIDFSDHPPEPAADDAAAVAAARAATLSLRAKRERQRRRSRIAIAGVAALAMLIGLSAMFVLLRHPILAAVPASERVYGALGLKPAPTDVGLEIRDLKSERVWEGGDDVLQVAGLVANVTEARETLPLLRLSLYDAADEEVQFVTLRPERDALDPGETLRFEARLANPPATARRLRVGFTE